MLIEVTTAPYRKDILTLMPPEEAEEGTPFSLLDGIFIWHFEYYSQGSHKEERHNCILRFRKIGN